MRGWEGTSHSYGGTPSNEKASMKNKYCAGQYWLKKLANPFSPDYRLLFILRTYIRPETKTKIPRFIYVIVNISKTGRYSRIHDDSITCLRRSLKDFLETTEQNLDFIVKYGSIKDVVAEACRQVEATSRRHIGWYQKKISKEQRLIEAAQEVAQLEAVARLPLRNN